MKSFKDWERFLEEYDRCITNEYLKDMLHCLNEKRRNPELNPKVDIIKALERRQDDPDIYISFVEDVGYRAASLSTPGALQSDADVSGFKIGINPKSRYNTPTGIYTYPLKQAFAEYANHKTRKLDVPFAGEAPMVYVLKARGNLLNLLNYNSSDYDKDIVNLRKIMINWEMKYNKISEALAWEMFKGIEYIGLEGSRIKTIGGKFWNISRLAFYRMVGNLETKIIKTKYQDEVMPMFQDKTMRADFNNQTVRIELKVRREAVTGTVKWNKLFRDLGYDGVTDKGNQGIIHPAEPMQAVFFSVKGFKVLDMVMNKSYIEQDTTKRPGPKVDTEDIHGEKSPWGDFIKPFVEFYYDGSKFQTTSVIRHINFILRDYQNTHGNITLKVGPSTYYKDFVEYAATHSAAMKKLDALPSNLQYLYITIMSKDGNVHAYFLKPSQSDFASFSVGPHGMPKIDTTRQITFDTLATNFKAVEYFRSWVKGEDPKGSDYPEIKMKGTWIT